MNEARSFQSSLDFSVCIPIPHETLVKKIKQIKQIKQRPMGKFRQQNNQNSDTNQIVILEYPSLSSLEM
jgi:hypothetical protein